MMPVAKTGKINLALPSMMLPSLIRYPLSGIRDQDGKARMRDVG
jgi:hypothetical protein